MKTQCLWDARNLHEITIRVCVCVIWASITIQNSANHFVLAENKFKEREREKNKEICK